MKKLTYQYLSILSTAAICIAPSCTKNFPNLNTDPNAITKVGAETLLPTIIRNAANTIVGEGWAVGNLVVQHTAKFQFVNVDRYNWGDMPTVWNVLYDNLRNIKIVEKQSEQNLQAATQAVAIILRSWTIAQITDLYGNVPYSQSTLADEKITLPTYDTQEQIYTQIFADLEKANDMLSKAQDRILGDPIFGGDKLKWQKLANSLHCRYLMRISSKKPIATALQNIIQNPKKYPIFQSSADNAVYRYESSLPNQYPISRYRSGSFDEIRLSKTMQTMLNRYQDPRLTVIAQPTSATATSATPQYLGMPNGMADADALKYNGGSSNISKIGSSFYQDATTSLGRRRAKAYFMGYPELQFLLAEAAHKSWINGGNAEAQTYYQNAIKAAFEYIEVPMPADYLTRTDVAFNTHNAPEQIANQLWIALFHTGFEAWAAWRRTGLPLLKPGVNNLNNNQIPSRFRYPINEERLNKTNNSASVALQNPYDINTKMWWQP